MLIAALGNPNIILLDEPSAGLDPISRRKVWHFIHQLKKPDVVILLATHDMAEAEFLADTIGILSNGVLKTIGTGLSLKTRYGTGFRLSLSLKDSEKAAGDVLAFVEGRLPGTTVIIRAGTYLTLAVPKSLSSVIPGFLRVMEGKLVPVANDITNFGISNSTLEEVFLNIIKGEAPARDVAFNDNRGINFTNEIGNFGEKNELDETLKGSVCALCCVNETSCVVALT